MKPDSDALNPKASAPLGRMLGLFAILGALALSGCGGGGGGGSTPASTPSPATTTLAVVKVATSGALPAGTAIGGIVAHVSASPSTGLSIADTDVLPTGVGAGALLAPNLRAGAVLGVLSATGLQTGEFATLTYHIAAGAQPQAGDFSVDPGASVIDATTGAVIPGITVAVQSVTFH